MAVRFSRSAVADLDAIYDYTVARWGVDQAEAYTGAIRTTCALLASGEVRSRPFIPGVLQGRSGRHLIFFRLEDQGLLVLRILHQSMDVPRHISQG